jgi:predicted permease
MRGFQQDIRYALRVLRRHPWTASIAVLSLALGVGANAVVFSLVDGMFLRPLPVSNPDQLVRIEWRSADGRPSGMAWIDFNALRTSGGAFADVAAQNRRGGMLGTGADPELVLLTVVSDNYFPMLGVTAAKGRLFAEGLDTSMADEPAVAITDGLWRRRFGADTALIGRTLRLNNRAFTVVGILPPGFRGLQRAVETEIWVPASTWRAMGNADEFEERVVGQFEPVARLRPGVSLEAAQAQLDLFTQRLQQEQPAGARGRRLVVTSQADFESGGAGRLLPTIFLSITGLLIVMACANVAQLLLALSETRQREVAIRQSLGAGRGRLVRQFMTESVLLALAGAVAAIIAAAWLIPLVPSLLPPGPSFVRYDIRLDGRVVAATFLTGTITVLLFGLVPALRGSRSDLTSLIKIAGWQARHPLGGRTLLVVAQAALGVMLVSAAGLLALSLGNAGRARPGFDIDRQTAIVHVSLGGTTQSLTDASDQVLERAAALPGLKGAAYCRRFPMAPSGGGATRDVVIPGRDVPADQQVLRIRYNQVSPEYFAVAGTRLVNGRTFTRADSADALPVALANDTMAKQFWPLGSPVGNWIRLGSTSVQIVGVVENAVVNSIHEPPQPFLYFPFAQRPSGEVTFLFETAGDPGAFLPDIRRVMRDVSPGHAPLSTNTLRQHLRQSLYQDWLQAVIAVVMASLGLLLASVGFVGVVMHSVTRRTREFGVRAALGATRRDIVTMVLRHGLVLTGVGGVLGVGLAWLAGRAISSLLVGVQPSNPIVIGGSFVVVLLIGVLGAAYPAWRASRVDPVHVLRAE